MHGVFGAKPDTLHAIVFAGVMWYSAFSPYLPNGSREPEADILGWVFYRVANK